MWENWRQTILSAGKKRPAPLFLPFFPVLFSFHVVFHLSSWCLMSPPFSLFFKHSLPVLSSFLSSGFCLSILVSSPCHLCLFLLFITTSPLVLLPLLSVPAFLFPYSLLFSSNHSIDSIIYWSLSFLLALLFPMLFPFFCFFPLSPNLPYFLSNL